ncbi:MAG: PLP-dependent aminotransferase family protein [Pseudonocardiaceae bacterium]|nr:MAG: PLP-dependent aminotransferase family protein [Pseudonocardiaceae bacterium]
MSSRTTSAGADLHLELAVDHGRGVRVALTDALRDAIRSGRLAPGTRLPATRSLATDLGLARTTVVEAYAELVAEGWLTARHGSATRVADRAPAAPRDPLPPAPPRTSAPRHDLMPGRPDVASFPRAEWLRATRRALAAAPDEAFGYGAVRGRVELREALAEYLARARGVRADPSHIVVCGGMSHGLALLAGVLRRRGVRAMAVESVGLHIHRDLLLGAGLRIPPVEVDELGARTDTLGRDVGAVLLTPAHQFPTGVALDPARRAAVVEWARTTGALVVEDDYDGEFRYDRQPVGALQGLDPEHVVHLGTASKALAPGLRLGWMVAPADVVAEIDNGSPDPEPSVTSALEQLVLADLLSSGAYDRHVRGRRRTYRRRRDQLVATLAERAPHVGVRGLAAGLHVVLTLPDGTEADVLRSAAWHGLAVEGLATFRHPGAASGPAGIVVGYATPSDSAWAGALEALCGVLSA